MLIIQIIQPGRTQQKDKFSPFVILIIGIKYISDLQFGIFLGNKTEMLMFIMMEFLIWTWIFSLFSSEQKQYHSFGVLAIVCTIFKEKASTTIRFW